VTEVAFNPTIARTLLLDSARHAYLAKRDLGNEPYREPSSEMDTGNAIHELVFGGHRIVAIDKPDWRTKEAQIWRAEQRAAHRIPMLQRQLDELLEIANRIIDRMRREGIVLAGESNRRFEWRQPTRAGSVLCHCEMDHLDYPRIVELKTTSCAHPKHVSRDIYNLGYDIQYAGYCDAFVAQGWAQDPDFVWVFAEIEPPHCITIGRPDALFKQMGRQRWARALRIWDACLACNMWPEYTTGIVDIAPQPWAFTEEMNADAEFYAELGE